MLRGVGRRHGSSSSNSRPQSNHGSPWACPLTSLVAALSSSLTSRLIRRRRSAAAAATSIDGTHQAAPSRRRPGSTLSLGLRHDAHEFRFRDRVTEVCIGDRIVTEALHAQTQPYVSGLQHS